MGWWNKMVRDSLNKDNKGVINMGKKLSTYYSEKGKGKCEIHIDLKNEYFYIKYFDNNDKQFFTEDFIGKTHRYVEDAANNWTVGIKELNCG